MCVFACERASECMRVLACILTRMCVCACVRACVFVCVSQFSGLCFCLIVYQMDILGRCGVAPMVKVFGHICAVDVFMCNIVHLCVRL